MLENNQSIAAISDCGGKLPDLLTRAGRFRVLGSVSIPALASASQNVSVE